MKRVLRTAMMAVLVMVLCVGALAPAAQAAQEPVDVNITATVTVKGTPSEGATSVFVLKDAEGQVVDTETLILPTDGSADVTFTIEDLAKVGEYDYTFQMVGGTYYVEELDGEIYNVKVTVYNSDDYQSFETKVTVRNEDLTEKPNKIEYDLELTSVTVNKKWVDQDSTRPTSVTIDLLLDGKVVDYASAVLNSSNKWQYTWEHLDARLGDYSVKEKKVPSGYTASYKYADGVWTVTNTGSLLQTGQLNWPIPVLCIAGISVMALGLYLMFARKKENNA